MQWVVNLNSQRFNQRWLTLFHSPSSLTSVLSSQGMNSLLNLWTSVLSTVWVISFQVVLLEFCSMIAQRLWLLQIFSTLFTLSVLEILKVVKVPQWNKLTNIISLSIHKASPRKWFCCSTLRATWKVTASLDLCSLISIKIICQKDQLIWRICHILRSGNVPRKQFC